MASRYARQQPAPLPPHHHHLGGDSSGLRHSLETLGKMTLLRSVQNFRRHAPAKGWCFPFKLPKRGANIPKPIVHTRGRRGETSGSIIFVVVVQTTRRPAALSSRPSAKASDVLPARGGGGRARITRRAAPRSMLSAVLGWCGVAFLYAGLQRRPRAVGARRRRRPARRPDSMGRSDSGPPHWRG